MKNENKTAFPTLFYTQSTGHPCGHDEGMTLRDYFATQAIQSPVNYRPINFYHWLKWFFGYSFKACSRPHKENAMQAYELADAMLKQRDL